MNYTEIHIESLTPELKEILVSLLADRNFESFAGEDDELLAYIPSEHFSREQVEKVCGQFGLNFVVKEIAGRNWNEEWEKNFEPVLIAGKCYIRAPFHPSRPEYPFEIVIEPKMSFGTAHHETTSMMIETMLDMNFQDKKVLDMGSGTGILAILASMMGAREVDAIDNDEWAFSNAKENVNRNDAGRITVKMGDVDAARSGYDVILANINRNVLTSQIPEYSRKMKSGELVMSGFYEEDIPVIKFSATSHGFTFDSMLTKNRWVALRFVK
jgi:ribosomal protein L11 methyltransferase